MLAFLDDTKKTTSPSILAIGHFTPPDPSEPAQSGPSFCFCLVFFSVREPPPSFFCSFLPLFLPPHRLVVFDNHGQLPSAVEPGDLWPLSHARTHAAAPSRRGPREAPPRSSDICGGARCCCPPTVFFTAERRCGKVTAEMDDALMIFNAPSMKNVGNLFAVNLQISVYLLMFVAVKIHPKLNLNMQCVPWYN